VLLGVRHLVRKYTLQRRQPSVRLLDLYEPSLTVGHTSYAVGNAYLRNAAELVGKTAKRPHTFTEVPLYFFLSHDKKLPQNFLHFKACIKFCCVYGGGPNSKVKDNKMENIRHKFDAQMRRTAHHWCAPRLSWEATDALAAPVYKYVKDTINAQKEMAIHAEVFKREFAVVVCPYDDNTLESLFETKPVLLSDIIMKHVRTFDDADEAFAAIAVSIKRARKKVEMLDD
jgi:hypothetical protein